MSIEFMTCNDNGKVIKYDSAIRPFPDICSGVEMDCSAEEEDEGVAV